MKKYIKEFIKRGLVAAGFGPVVLGILYLILYKAGVLETVTVNQVCTGIFSLFTLAFIAGGMNVIYQIERIPLMVAILIHGTTLYISYLLTYLVNGWIESGTTPVLVFTIIFVIFYLAIWIVIYSVTIKNTRKLNKLLDEKNKISKIN